MAVKKKIASAKIAKKGHETKKASSTKSKKTGVIKKAAKHASALPSPDKKAAKQAAVSRKSELTGTKPVITTEQRHSMICNAAYLLSLKRDPCHGCPETDWVNAETVIDMVYDVKI